MATHGGATTTLWGQSGASFVSADTVVSADQGVVVCIGWEGDVTISGSVTDDVGQTYTLIKEELNTGGPHAAIYYKASHPGGAAVNVSCSFSGGGATYGGITVIPMNGGAGGVDGTPTSSQGENASSFSAGAITTTGVGFVVQWLVGFQGLTGVAAGGTPAFTRDTASEAANGGTQTSFAQYLLSGSAQSVTPGCSWAAATSQYAFVAAAFKDSAGGGATKSHINGIAESTISHLNGIAKASISHINGLAR